MISYELVAKIDRFLDEFPFDGFLRQTLGKMSSHYSAFLEASAALITTSASTAVSDAPAFARYRDPVVALFNEIDGQVKAIRVRKLYAAIDSLDRHLDDFEKLGEGQDDYCFIKIKETIDRFEKSYDSYSMQNSLGGLLRLLSLAHSLNTDLNTLTGTLKTVREALRASAPRGARTEQTFFSIYLQSSDALSVFIIKAQALENIYGELCRLLNVSASEYPLRIGRLEAGSLRAFLLGESKVINLMIELARAAVGYLHRNFTREGKLAALPRDLETIRDYLNLEEKLKERGYDTTAMREGIQKASVAVTKQLNALLIGEPVVDINGQFYAVGSDADRALPGKSETPLLEGRVAEPPPSQDGEATD